MLLASTGVSSVLRRKVALLIICYLTHTHTAIHTSVTIQPTAECSKFYADCLLLRRLAYLLRSEKEGMANGSGEADQKADYSSTGSRDLATHT